MAIRKNNFVFVSLSPNIRIFHIDLYSNRNIVFIMKKKTMILMDSDALEEMRLIKIRQGVPISKQLELCYAEAKKKSLFGWWA